MLRAASIPKAGPLLLIPCHGQDCGPITCISGLLPLWRAHRSEVQGCSQQLPCELTVYSLGLGREETPHPSSSPATSLVSPYCRGLKENKSIISIIFFLNEQMHKAAKGNQVKNKSAWLQAESVIVNEV